MNIWELSTNLHKRQESPWPPTIPYGGPKGSPIVFLAGLSPKWWHQFYLLPIFQNNQHVYFTIFMRRQNRYLFKRPTTKWKEKFKIISIKWKLEMEWAIVEDMDWVCINQIIWKVCRKIIVDLSIDLWHFHKRALFVLKSRVSTNSRKSEKYIRPNGFPLSLCGSRGFRKAKNFLWKVTFSFAPSAI